MAFRRYWFALGHLGRALVATLALVTGAALTADPARTQDFTMKFATLTINDIQHEFIKMYKPELEKATNNRIKVDIYPAGQLGGAPRQTEGLRLGMMQVISVVDVGSLIARFHRERPLVDIQPRTAPGGSAAMISDIRRGTLDAAFVAVSGPDQPGLTATTLASEPVLLGCLPDHPLARRAVVSVSELAGEPFVDYTPGWGTRTIADQLFARAGVERSIGIEVPDSNGREPPKDPGGRGAKPPGLGGPEE